MPIVGSLNPKQQVAAGLHSPLKQEMSCNHLQQRSDVTAAGEQLQWGLCCQLPGKPCRHLPDMQSGYTTSCPHADLPSHMQPGISPAGKEALLPQQGRQACVDALQPQPTCARCVVVVSYRLGLYGLTPVAGMLPHPAPFAVILAPSGGHHVGCHDIADPRVDACTRNSLESTK